MDAATTYLFNLFVVAKRVLNRGDKCARRNQRQRPSLHPWRLACTKAARSVHRGGTHQRMQARSAHAGSVGSSMHAGRLVGCMHRRLLSWRRAQAFNARDGPTKPRPNGRTSTPPSAAPLVRVNGQSTDPTATSVVTSSEGFGQGSGEN